MVTRREANLAILSSAVLAAAPGLAVAQTPPTLELPPPRASGGKPLIDALKQRRSMRDYADRPLPAQVLSDLLWAAFGVNRPASGDRTAPSWRHSIEIGIYVTTAEGVWRFEPQGHRLKSHLRGDIRAQTGVQDSAGTAAVNLVYVADGNRMGSTSQEDKRLWAFTDTGFIGQNVYLFCASEGLASVFRGSLDREALARTLQLDRHEFITCAQSVGYPKG
jgi:nitroreductase